MAKYITDEGIRRVLIAIKNYIDTLVGDNELITATAFNEVEQMISSVRTDVDTVDSVNASALNEVERMFAQLHDEVAELDE